MEDRVDIMTSEEDELLDNIANLLTPVCHIRGYKLIGLRFNDDMDVVVRLHKTVDEPRLEGEDVRYYTVGEIGG